MKILSLLLLAIVPAALADEPGARPKLTISLKRAVEIATSPEGNTNIQLSGEALKGLSGDATSAPAMSVPTKRTQAG